MKGKTRSRMRWMRLFIVFMLCVLFVQNTGGCPILWSYSIDGITALSVSDSGNFVAVGCEDGWYYIFDTFGNRMGSGRVTDAVVSLDIADTGDLIVGFSNGYTFCTVDGMQVSSVGAYSVQRVSMSSDGSFSLACCQNDLFINRGTHMAMQFDIYSDYLFGTVSADGNLACAASDASLYIFDNELNRWYYESDEEIKHLFVSSNGKKITFSTTTMIGYIDMVTEKAQLMDVGFIQSMAASPSGDIIVFSTESTLAWLKEKSVVNELAISDIQVLSVTDDGLAITKNNNQIQIMTIEGTPLFTYDFERPVTDLQVSSGKDLLVASTNSGIYTFQLFNKIQTNTHVISLASRKSLPLTSPLEEVWSVPVAENAYFLTADMDGDGLTEILLCEIPKLKLLDGNGILLAERDLGRHFGVNSLLDVDGDTICEIPLELHSERFIFAVYDWDKDTTREYYLDSLGKDPLQDATTHPLAVIDSNGDGSLEILTTFGVGYSCKPRGVLSIDYESGEIRWIYQRGTGPMTQAVADINGDGSVEIVLGCMAPCTCSYDEEYPDCECLVTVLSDTGEKLWEVHTGNGFQRIAVSVADIHEYEGTEIIGYGFDASETWGSLFVLTCDGKVLYNREFDYAIVPGAVADIDGDGATEIVAADSRGYVTIFSDDLQEKSTKYVVDDVNNFSKLYINDFNGDGSFEIFLNTKNELFIFDKDLNLLWQKEFPALVWYQIANFSQCKNTLLVLSDKLYAYKYEETGEVPCPLWEITKRTLIEEGLINLSTAESLFSAGEYVASRPYYEIALDRFSKLEDEEKMNRISEKIGVSTYILKQNVRIGIIFLGVCDGILCVFLLYFLFIKRRSPLVEGALLLSLPFLLGLFQVYFAVREYLEVFVTYFVPSLILSVVIILRKNILNYIMVVQYILYERPRSIEEEMLDFKEISPNPYNISKPITSKIMFFGRQDIIDYVKSHISKSELDNILVLHGERRIGKTSILYQLRDHHLFQDHIPVYINMQAIADKGTDVFFYNLSEFIIDALEKANLAIERPHLDEFQRAPTTYFNRKIVKPIEKKLEDRKLILLFDEFEELHKRVEDKKIDEDALSFLRSVMLESSKIAFIFTGTHQLTEIMGQYWSILFNISLHKKINTLSREDTIDLVVEPVEKYNMWYQEKAKEHIFQITGGHPYFVQLVCLELVDYHNRTKKSYIKIGDVNKILDKILERGYYHFRFVWEQSKKDEKIFLAALADLENAEKIPTTATILSLIKEHLPSYTLERLLDASDRLLRREVVTKDKDLYKFKIEIIKKWINQYRKLYEIIEEVT